MMPVKTRINSLILVFTGKICKSGLYRMCKITQKCKYHATGARLLFHYMEEH